MQHQGTEAREARQCRPFSVETPSALSHLAGSRSKVHSGNAGPRKGCDWRRISQHHNEPDLPPVDPVYPWSIPLLEMHHGQTAWPGCQTPESLSQASIVREGKGAMREEAAHPARGSAVQTRPLRGGPCAGCVFTQRIRRGPGTVNFNEPAPDTLHKNSRTREGIGAPFPVRLSESQPRVRSEPTQARSSVRLIGCRTNGLRPRKRQHSPYAGPHHKTHPRMKQSTTFPFRPILACCPHPSTPESSAT